MSDFRKSIRKHLKNPPTEAAPRNLQSLILTGLNVLQVLEEQAPKYLQNFLHYGPDSFRGDAWAANLIWYRETGYSNYKELQLFGVWAKREESGTNLLLGTKLLAFSAPVFNAESYNAIIKTSFKPYYQDDASPPPSEDIIFQIQYEESRRLALRRELADEIIKWLRNRT